MRHLANRCRAANHRRFNGFKPPLLTDSNDSQSSGTDTYLKARRPATNVMIRPDAKPKSLRALAEVVRLELRRPLEGAGLLLPLHDKLAANYFTLSRLASTGLWSC